MKLRYILPISVMLFLLSATSAVSFTSTPADIEITEYEFATLSWQVDGAVDYYTITMDNGNGPIVVSRGTAENGRIEIDIQNLAIGTYNFTLNIGSERDSVIVTVVESDAGTTSENTPISLIPILSLLGVTVFIKRKKL